MKVTFLAVTAALSLMAAAAHAEAEGAGNPFAFQASGMTVASLRAQADTGSAAYLNFSGYPSRLAVADASDTMPAYGSEGIVQTANSLPHGLVDDMAADAQGRSVQRYFVDEVAQPSRDSQTAAAVRGKPHS